MSLSFQSRVCLEELMVTALSKDANTKMKGRCGGIKDLVYSSVFVVVLRCFMM